LLHCLRANWATDGHPSAASTAGYGAAAAGERRVWLAGKPAAQRQPTAVSFSGGNQLAGRWHLCHGANPPPAALIQLLWRGTLDFGILFRLRHENAVTSRPRQARLPRLASPASPTTALATFCDRRAGVADVCLDPVRFHVRRAEAVATALGAAEFVVAGFNPGCFRRWAYAAFHPPHLA